MTEPKKVKSANNKVRKKSPKGALELLLSALGLMLWVGVSVIASQSVVGHLMVWTIGEEAATQPVPTAIYSALSYILAMLLIILVPKALMAKWKKLDCDKKDEDMKSFWTALGLKDWPTWTDIGLAPVGFFVYLLLAAGLTALFSLFPWFNAEEAQAVGFSFYLTGFNRVIAFIVLVIIAPLAEEIIFRGWLYDKLRGKFLEKYSNVVSMVVSSLLVSILFGIVHLQWNVGVNVFALSVVACALREITGTIHAGILLHMLKNGVAFYLLYILGIS